MSNALAKLDASALKEMGVEFKVTKAELIDTIIEEQLEVIEEDKKRVVEELNVLKEKSYTLTNVKKVFAKRELPAFMRAFLKHCEADITDHRGYDNVVTLKFTIPQDCGMVLRYHGELQTTVKKEDLPHFTEIQALQEEYKELTLQECQLQQGTKKIKREFIRKILSSSEKGQGLVALLDSYKAPRTRKARALAATTK